MSIYDVMSEEMSRALTLLDRAAREPNNNMAETCKRANVCVGYAVKAAKSTAEEEMQLEGEEHLYRAGTLRVLKDALELTSVGTMSLMSLAEKGADVKGQGILDTVRTQVSLTYQICKRAGTRVDGGQ